MGTNRFEREIESLVKENGGELLQVEPHRKYRFPNGGVFVLSSTPSDHRAARNQLRDLKRLLGITLRDKMKRESKQKTNLAGKAMSFADGLTRKPDRALSNLEHRLDEWERAQGASFREKLSRALESRAEGDGQS